MRRIFSGRLLLLGILFVLSLRMVGDYDVFFHMVVGREVVRRMALPAEEFYILLLQGQPAAFYEWGFGVLYYLVHEAAGPVGMSLFNALLAAAALTLVIGAGLRRETPWWIGLIAAAPLLWWMSFRLVFRPETLLMLFLAIEIVLLERFLASPRYRLLAPLPVLDWLLAQCHPSPLFMLAVFGAYALQAVIRAAPEARLGRGLRLAGIAVAMALAAALNPYGLEQIFLPFKFAAQAELFDSVVEFLPALDSPMRWTFAAAAAMLLAALCAPTRRLVDILLVLVFGFLAYRYIRNFALFAFIGAVPLTRAVEWLTGRLPRRMAATVAVAGAAVLVSLPVRSGHWGVGIEPGVFPDAGVEMLARYRPSGNILNFFHLGSYLRWRLDDAYPVFVDGRNYVFNKAMEAHKRIFSASPDWRDELSRLDINIIMTPATIAHSGQLIPLVVALADDPGWELVSVEPAALTFLRAGASPDTPRQDKDAVWRQVVEEAQRTLADDPGAALARQAIDYARKRLAAPTQSGK